MFRDSWYRFFRVARGSGEFSKNKSGLKPGVCFFKLEEHGKPVSDWLVVISNLKVVF